MILQYFFLNIEWWFSKHIDNIIISNNDNRDHNLSKAFTAPSVSTNPVFFIVEYSSMLLILATSYHVRVWVGYGCVEVGGVFTWKAWSNFSDEAYSQTELLLYGKSYPNCGKRGGGRYAQEFSDFFVWGDNLGILWLFLCLFSIWCWIEKSREGTKKTCNLPGKSQRITYFNL